jgi:PAS domain S-box-containing protein
LSNGFSALDKTLLEMIVAQAPIEEVLSVLCESVEQQAAGALCSVLLLDGNGKVVDYGGAPALPAALGLTGERASAEPPRGRVLVFDIENDPDWGADRALAVSHRLRSCWSIPLLSHDGKMLGAFACYFRELKTPEPFHLQLLERASHLAGIAIERERAKAELQAAESRYRMLVERLPAITYIAEVGALGRWHYVSPQIYSMLGFSQEEWTSASVPWLSRIHPDDVDTALAAEKQVQENGAIYQAEYRMYARDSRMLWFRDEAVLMSSKGGQAPLMQGVMYDITEHKKLEDQLRQAQKMEAVGQLAGGVAHDFNNLLMIIQAHAERIQKVLGSEHAAYPDAVEIRHAITRAASLANQLLAFSRKQRLQPKVLDLNSVLGEVGKMLSRLLVENISLRIEASPTLAKVKIDQGQIEQAILNLAVNARDAMPQGGVLTLAVRNVEFREMQISKHGNIAAGRYVVLEVSDTGSGMDAKTQAHIFEPFFTTKRPDKGTGLGLSTVYGVVQQSGGSIAVHSVLGEGTTFKIYIPQVDVELDADQTPAAAPQAAPAVGSETILLVEDQGGIRDVVTQWLERSGYTVLHASDGEEALQVAARYDQTIHLLVTDLMMPNLGGRELASRLVSRRPGLKVIYISGYPEYANRTAGPSGEPVTVLQKPFSLAVLATMVRELLDHDRAIAAPGGAS